MKDSGEVLLQEADESVGGRVVGADVRVVLQLRLDLLRQLLPQFNAVSRKQEVSDVTGSCRRSHLNLISLSLKKTHLMV